ncbi:hypothetical protein CEN40_22545 [Fischerella thermalis CCMEE 5205]|nr:hypothetical protein CEN40_22545 [Fischerella thermalis CCMEE 5205]
MNMNMVLRNTGKFPTLEAGRKTRISWLRACSLRQQSENTLMMWRRSVTKTNVTGEDKTILLTCTS